jgi:SAM-dependent methyltransferase
MMPRMRQAQPEISGDVRLSIADRFRYLWRNGARNLSSLGGGPPTQRFHWPSAALPPILGQSPSRYLTELFLATELPCVLPPVRPISVVEIGCGSGSMASRLEGLGYGGSYLGIDIENRFISSRGTLARTFLQADAHDLVPQHPIDLLISVSALEHIARDTDLVRRLSGHMAPGGVQLHFVPAPAALLAYLWHGYRQYSPVDISERFGPSTRIVRLGGVGTTLLHLLAITPEIFVGRFVRARSARLYAVLLRGALALDRLLPFFPTAYAVVRRH